MSTLFPEHLADLRKSGLLDETIAAANISSLTRAFWSVYLSEPVCTALEKVSGSAMLIPYAFPETFPLAPKMFRVKLFPPVPTADGRPMRYYQRARTGARLYIPPRARTVLADAAMPLWFVEGEKKALAAEQTGLACIGLGGVWNWLAKTEDGPSQPSVDLDAIDLRREINIVPDSDVWTRPLLRQAVYAFARELFDNRGAKPVVIIKLPPGPDGTKQGLDDYLAAGGQIETLERVTLNDRVFDRRWYKTWVKRRDLPTEDGSAEDVSVEELRRRAAPVFDAPDPFVDAIWPALRVGYGGDLTGPKLLYLAMTGRVVKQRLGSSPAHTLVIAPSSTGKSYSVGSMKRLFPPQVYIEIDAGTPKTLIYLVKPVAYRALLYAEMDSIPKDQEGGIAASAIRTLLQEHRLRYHVVVKDPETHQMVTREIVKEGPTTLITTSVRELHDEQLRTRLFELDMPDNINRIRQTLKTRARLETGAALPEVDPALLALQAYLQAQAPIDVIVPFADELAEWLGRGEPESRIRRDYERLLTLIKAVTAVRHARRQQNEDGRWVATIDDYVVVYDLAADMYEGSVSGVSNTVRQTVETLKGLKEANPNSVTNVTDLGKALGINKKNASVRVKNAARLGYIRNEESRVGYSAILVIGDKLPARSSLPDPEELRSQTSPVRRSVRPPGAPPPRPTRPVWAPELLGPNDKGAVGSSSAGTPKIFGVTE
jgi:hypothetical protein